MSSNTNKVILPQNPWEPSNLPFIEKEVLYLLKDRFPLLVFEISFGKSLKVTGQESEKVSEELRAFLEGEEDDLP